MPRRMSSDSERSESPYTDGPYYATTRTAYAAPMAPYEYVPAHPHHATHVRQGPTYVTAPDQPYAYRVRRVIPAGLPVAPVLARPSRVVEEEPIIVVPEQPVERVQYVAVAPKPAPPPQPATPRVDEELLRRLEQVERELDRERERNAELEGERMALLKRRDAERARDTRDETIDSLRNKLSRLAEERASGPDVDELRAKINRLEAELADERRDREVERREWETKQRHVQDMLERERDREEAESQELIHLQRRLLQEKDDEIRYLSQLASAHKEQIGLLHSQINIEEVDEILGVDHRLLRADVMHVSPSDVARGFPADQQGRVLSMAATRDQNSQRYRDFVGRATAKGRGAADGYTSTSDFDEPARPARPLRTAHSGRESDTGGYRSDTSLTRRTGAGANHRHTAAGGAGAGAGAGLRQGREESNSTTSSARLVELRRQLEEAKQEREKVARMRSSTAR